MYIHMLVMCVCIHLIDLCTHMYIYIHCRTPLRALFTDTHSLDTRKSPDFVCKLQVRASFRVWVFILNSGFGVYGLRGLWGFGPASHTKQWSRNRTRLRLRISVVSAVHRLHVFSLTSLDGFGAYSVITVEISYVLLFGHDVLTL